MSLLNVKEKFTKLPNGWSLLPISKLISDTQYGTSEASNDDSGIPVVGMKNLQNGKVNLEGTGLIKLPTVEEEKLLLKRGDILLNRTNSYELVGKVGYYDLDEKAVFASYLVRLVVNSKKADSKYLSFWLNSDYAQQLIKKIATKAISQANINPTEFKKYCWVPTAPLLEQKAIADLLSTWDLAIGKMERLIAAKERRFRWLMDELICKPIKQKKWGKRYLHELFIPVVAKNTVNETNVLTSSAQHGLVSQLKYYNKSVSAEDVSGYYLLHKGDFAYNRSSSVGYPYGAIKRLDESARGVLSTLYLCMQLKDQKNSWSDFFVYFFESGILNIELQCVCQEGARSHGLLNITKADFFNLNLACPDFEKQKEIANVLDVCKKETQLLNTLLEKFKEQKRGLMQKLLIGEWRVKTGIYE